MSEQDLIGFDDGPVPQAVVNGKTPVNGNAVEITKTEMVLNNLNNEKSLHNGKQTEVEAVNGNHEAEVDYDDTPLNGHLNGTGVEDADDGQTKITSTEVENGEHVYSEVPEKESGEDNIYEEVLPVAARRDKESLQAKPEGQTENANPLYDDSSLSSELSADLSPPPSNTEDATGAVMSDPECDAVMAVEHAAEEAPAVVAKGSEPVNDTEPAYEDASSVAEVVSVNGTSFAGSVVNEGQGYTEIRPSVPTSDVVPLADETSDNLEGPCYANVDVFVDCVETTEADEASEEQSADATQPFVTDETVKTVTYAEITPTPEIGVVKKEHPQLRTGRTETIIDKEIRAQKEREEMIAQERKLAQEIMKQTVSLEKEAVAAQPLTPKIPITTSRQTSLNSAPSTPASAVSSPAPFPAPVEKRYNCPSDSRIADEIRELREREEELKELRERLQAEGELMAKTGIQQKPNKTEDEMTNGSSTPSSCSTGLSRTMSVESVQNGQGTPSLAFGSRRKDRITVKPLTDETESLSPTVFSPPNGESPIEREIRMARDREEALRREKLLLGQLQAEGFIKKCEFTPVATKPTANKAPRGPVIGSTQKILATSRIQQEIEEQTQREMDLRASGHIQTISQERTDSRVTGIGNSLVTGRPEEAVTKTPPLPQPAFLANDTSIPNVEIYEKTPPATKQATPVSNGKSVGGLTPVASKNGSTARAVSMQKFIASRGKELVFTQPQNGSCGSDVGSSYCELKPPQVRRGSGVDRKGFVTAETKIQEELRAMKEREEELKRQRKRLLGHPQQSISPVEHGKTSSLDQMTSSAENLWLQEQASDRTDGADDMQLLSSPDANNSSGPRRRSALIAQWEQRIQKTDTVKS